jgi:hypothetical protein
LGENRSGANASLLAQVLAQMLRLDLLHLMAKI